MLLSDVRIFGDVPFHMDKRSVKPRFIVLMSAGGYQSLAEHVAKTSPYPGFHWWIERDGTIWNVLPPCYLAHVAKGFDQVSLGVCFAGDGTSEPVTDAQWIAWGHLGQALLVAFGPNVAIIQGEVLTGARALGVARPLPGLLAEWLKETYTHEQEVADIDAS